MGYGSSLVPTAAVPPRTLPSSDSHQGTGDLQDSRSVRGGDPKNVEVPPVFWVKMEKKNMGTMGKEIDARFLMVIE